jgi:hypothetical protein
MPHLDYGADGNFGGVSVLAPDSKLPAFRARVTPIDALDLAACHFIKVDVEGFEPDVLRGAQATIARHRPILYVENDRPQNQQEVISLIDAMDYRQYWHTPPLFDPKNPNGRQENVFPGIVSVNLFCIPKERDSTVQGVDPIDPKNWVCPVGGR